MVSGLSFSRIAVLIHSFDFSTFMLLSGSLRPQLSSGGESAVFFLSAVFCVVPG